MKNSKIISIGNSKQKKIKIKIKLKFKLNNEKKFINNFHHLQ